LHGKAASNGHFLVLKQRLLALQTSPAPKPSIQFWVLSAFLAAVFLMGGSSRADVQSLIILRPLAVLVCGYGLYNAKQEHFVRYRWLFLVLLGAIALCVAHLTPLPPSVWGALPNRGLVVKIDEVAALGGVWRPLSLAPSDTLNALFSLSVPLAVALLCVQLSERETHRVMSVVLALGLVSGILGFAQAIAPGSSALYFYDLSNENTSTGLFSNRNHHALLLAMCYPMTAAYLSQIDKNPRAGLIFPAAVAMALLLFPLILLSGSRGGLILGLLSIALAIGIVGWFPVKRAKEIKRSSLVYLFVFGGTIIAIATVALLFSRAEAIDRLINFNIAEELRFSIWEPTLQLTRTYLPWGSGIGTFVPVFLAAEPNSALNLLYVNHAHNEILELLLTGGIPALLLVGAAMLKWAIFTKRALRKRGADEAGDAFAQAGTIIIFLLFLASIIDYPARTPAMMSIAVLAAIWAQGRRNSVPSATDGAQK
jgi:O-antigen ligase